MPTLAGYITFIRSNMGVTSEQLPDDSPDIPLTYNAALDWVNTDILHYAPRMYDLCVYNLAASFLVNWSGADVFVKYRESFNLNNLYAGVISASSDESTSQTRLIPDFFKNLSLADLQMLRDPYGRQYLMIAQQFGSLWGLTQ